MGKLFEDRSRLHQRDQSRFEALRLISSLVAWQGPKRNIFAQHDSAYIHHAGVA